MFFFIAGIQPKTVILDSQPGLCPSCGLMQARTKRVDHYISVFFLPVLRVKKGPVFTECSSCGSMDMKPTRAMPGQPSKMNTCTHCGGPLEPGFRFCPNCGRQV